MNNFSLYIRSFLMRAEGKEPIVELFFKHKKVLDLGSGQGDFLAKDPAHFIGVDTNDELIAKAKQRGLHVEKASVTAVPFREASFDGVYCVNVIEHLFPAEALQMMSEAARVLKPGGIF